MNNKITTDIQEILPDVVAVVYDCGNFPIVPNNPHWNRVQNAEQKKPKIT